MNNYWEEPTSTPWTTTTRIPPSFIEWLSFFSADSTNVDKLHDLLVNALGIKEAKEPTTEFNIEEADLDPMAKQAIEETPVSREEIATRQWETANTTSFLADLASRMYLDSYGSDPVSDRFVGNAMGQIWSFLEQNLLDPNRLYGDTEWVKGTSGYDEDPLKPMVNILLVFEELINTEGKNNPDMLYAHVRRAKILTEMWNEGKISPGSWEEIKNPGVLESDNPDAIMADEVVKNLVYLEHQITKEAYSRNMSGAYANRVGIMLRNISDENWLEGGGDADLFPVPETIIRTNIASQREDEFFDRWGEEKDLSKALNNILEQMPVDDIGASIELNAREALARELESYRQSVLFSEPGISPDELEKMVFLRARELTGKGEPTRGMFPAEDSLLPVLDKTRLDILRDQASTDYIQNNFGTMLEIALKGSGLIPSDIDVDARQDWERSLLNAKTFQDFMNVINPDNIAAQFEKQRQDELSKAEEERQKKILAANKKQTEQYLADTEGLKATVRNILGIPVGVGGYAGSVLEAGAVSQLLKEITTFLSANKEAGLIPDEVGRGLIGNRKITPSGNLAALTPEQELWEARTGEQVPFTPPTQPAFPYETEIPGLLPDIIDSTRPYYTDVPGMKVWGDPEEDPNWANMTKEERLRMLASQSRRQFPSGIMEQDKFGPPGGFSYPEMPPRDTYVENAMAALQDWNIGEMVGAQYSAGAPPGSYIGGGGPPSEYFESIGPAGIEGLPMRFGPAPDYKTPLGQALVPYLQTEGPEFGEWLGAAGGPFGKQAPPLTTLLQEFTQARQVDSDEWAETMMGAAEAMERVADPDKWTQAERDTYVAAHGTEPVRTAVDYTSAASGSHSSLAQSLPDASEFLQGRWPSLMGQFESTPYYTAQQDRLSEEAAEQKRRDDAILASEQARVRRDEQDRRSMLSRSSSRGLFRRRTA